MKTKPHHKAKKVVDTKTGKVYLSVKEASLDAKCSRTHLASQLNGTLENKTSLRYI